MNLLLPFTFSDNNSICSFFYHVKHIFGVFVSSDKSDGIQFVTLLFELGELVT